MIPGLQTTECLAGFTFNQSTWKHARPNLRDLRIDETPSRPRFAACPRCGSTAYDGKRCAGECETRARR